MTNSYAIYIIYYYFTNILSSNLNLNTTRLRRGYMSESSNNRNNKRANTYPRNEESETTKKHVKNMIIGNLKAKKEYRKKLKLIDYDIARAKDKLKEISEGDSESETLKANLYSFEIQFNDLLIPNYSQFEEDYNTLLSEFMGVYLQLTKCEVEYDNFKHDHESKNAKFFFEACRARHNLLILKFENLESKRIRIKSSQLEKTNELIDYLFVVSNNIEKYKTQTNELLDQFQSKFLTH